MTCCEHGGGRAAAGFPKLKRVPKLCTCARLCGAGRMDGQGTFVWSTGERYDGGWKVRARPQAAIAQAARELPV